MTEPAPPAPEPTQLAYDATTGLSEPTVRGLAAGGEGARRAARSDARARAVDCPPRPPPRRPPFSSQAPCKKHVTTWLGKCVFKGAAPDGRTAPSEECTKTLNTWLSSCVFKV